MQQDETEDEAAPMPTVSMDPLTHPMPLTRPGVLQPYAAPFKGSTHRPVFGPEHLRAPREIAPESVPLLDTHAQLVRDQERRERQAAADRERRASMPTQAELQARRNAALEADVNALRVTVANLERRLAQLEAPRLRSRRSTTQGGGDEGPRAA
jgi:hypothetical protein